MWKVIPNTLVCIVDREFVLLPVVRILAHPPGNHPAGAPIVSTMTAVECRLSNGQSRWFGTESAMIGPDLRMHIIVNPRDEVLAGWEDSAYYGKE